MNDETNVDQVMAELRTRYNAPPPTPKDEMWRVIRAGLPVARTASVRSLEEARARRGTPNRSFGWAVAAAAVLMLGIGIGRMTVPLSPMADSAAARPDQAVFMMAAADHLGQSESFLTVVRAEARAGTLDPEMVGWARGLLMQTRLFLDATEPGTQPAFRELMEDLELVLAQVVSVAEGGQVDADRTRTELDLALRGMEDREVMTRIQAASAPTLAGT